jgi:hypothetical protein
MIHRERKRAVCPSCRAVYDWKADPRAAPIHTMGKPEGFAIERQPDKMLMRFPLTPWHQKLTLLRVAAVGDIVGLSILWLGINDPLGGAGLANYLPMALGLGITVYAIIALIIRGELFADHQTVRYALGPIAISSKVFRAEEIRQVYVRQDRHRTKSGGNFVYQVRFLLANGDSQTVVRNLRNSEYALYIEQELESFLKIEPAPVYGAFH